MALRLPSRKTAAFSLIGIALAYLLFAWLALPSILQAQSEKFIAEKTGDRLTMERPRFNPFTLSLRLSGLRLVQGDGKPLLAFRELLVDLSAASILRGAFIFEGVRLDGLEATVVLLPNGRLNWSELIDALKSKDQTADSNLPRLDMRRFVLSGARLDLSDRRTATAFTTRIEPIDLELTDVTTLSNDKGQYQISANTAFGARVGLHGQVSLEPLAVTGNFRIDNVELNRLADNFKDSLPFNLAGGLAGLSADYRLGYAKGRPELKLEHIVAKLDGLKLLQSAKSGPVFMAGAIEAKQGSFDLAKNYLTLGALSVTGSKLDLQRASNGAPNALELGSLVLDDVRIDLAGHQATLGHLALKDGRIHATRDKQGRIDLMQALQPAAPVTSIAQAKQQTSAAGTQAAWRYRLEKVELAGFTGSFRDEAVTPAAEMTLEDISASVEGISEDRKSAIPLRASFKSRDGGDFTAEGKIIPAGPSADIRLKLADLNLKPAQPYLAGVVKLKLAKAKLSAEGHLNYSDKGAGYRGSFSLDDLNLIETETGNVFLAWKSLGSRSIAVTPVKLDIGELTVDGINTQLIVNKDKSLSIARIFRQPAPDVAPRPASTVAPAAAPINKSAPSFLVNVDRLRVTHGEMDFADYSLSLPFGTRIHHLNGVITGLSSRPGAPSQLELSGQVDDYGLARANGQVNLFNPTDMMDINVVFRNVEMTRLTPYSATFAGRKIASGKLSLNLEYKIKQRQLQGENQVILDQLTLGEKVDSPEAKNLPLDLAIAILQDSDGRIDLGLPVSGDLNDPQFSYGSIIWKAITNVLTKIVSAPFRALGALFGGGEKFENITFEAGDAHLLPPEREKLVKLADALAKRPGLSLAIHGVYAEADRAALQNRQLRRTVAERIGISLTNKEDPGPISTGQPKVQAALESLFSERFGAAELTAVKDGFRQANPGQMEQNTVGKMISRLSGVLRENRSLNEQEVAQLKGADFYAVLFDRLRNKEIVDDASLLALAKTRGETAATALQAAGAPAERLEVLASEKVDSDKGTVPVKLVLNAAAKAAAPTPVPGCCRDAVNN